MDDSFSIFTNKQELHFAPVQLNKQFACFGLTMHIGSPTTKSKTKVKSILLTKFKYLGSFITPLLNEDAEIESRIKKAKSIMGASRNFLTTKT
jgi:hypothetical protein